MRKVTEGDPAPLAALQAGAAIAALAWLPWAVWAALFVPPARAVCGMSSVSDSTPPATDQAEEQEFELIP